MLVYIVGIVASAGDSQAQQITTKITADNGYALFTAPAETAPLTFIGTDSNGLASQIRAAETFTFSVVNTGYIFVVAWSDFDDAQGLLASFSGAQTILTGDKRWQVFPTKTNLRRAGSPNSTAFAAAVSGQIGLATATNQWTVPAVGPSNLSSSTTLIGVPGVTSSAQWMWYESGRCPGPSSPFRPGCDHAESLIFRLPARDLLPTPCIPVNLFNLCCMGKNNDGKLTFAFAVLARNTSTVPRALSISAPAATLTYSPTTLQPGQSNVIGMFTLNADSTQPVCLTFQLQGQPVCSAVYCWNTSCPGIGR